MFVFYVPCLSNPGPAFLLTSDLMGISLCACWLVWYFFFHLQNNEASPRFMLSIDYQPIINTGLPTWICSRENFYSLPPVLRKLDCHQSLSSFSSAIEHLYLLQSSPYYYSILECTSNTTKDIFMFVFFALADLASFKFDFLAILGAVFLFMLSQFNKAK